MKTQRTDQPDNLGRLSWRALSRNPYDVRMSDDEVAAEVAWLIGTDTPSSIAHRLGFKTMEGLIRFLSSPAGKLLLWSREGTRPLPGEESPTPDTSAR